MTTRNEKTQALPGLLSTIAAGFEVITSHLWLVIFPIVIDVFYWIGPQLRTTKLWLSFADLLRDTGVMVEMSDQLVAVAERTNLFTVFSVPFLGIPGLMAGIVMPEQMPLRPPTWEINGLATLFLLFIAISLAGLLLSAVFHALIAGGVSLHDDGEHELSQVQSQAHWRYVLSRLPVTCIRILGLAILLLMVVLTLYLPLMLAATVVTLISPTVGSLVMLSGLLMIVWVVFYMSFGLHGIILRGRPVFLALLDSLRLVQRNWSSALSLFLLIIAVRNLLSWLWLIVDTGSWLTLINIAGYAFVNTALIAATFIFYRDRIRLMEQGFLNE